MNYLKTVFKIKSLDDALFCTVTGVGALIALALSPVWFPFYILGRTLLYVVDKEWKDEK